MYLPGLFADKEPHRDVKEGLEEQERDDREQGQERQEVPGGFPLDQGVVGPAVPDHDDGQRPQANVDHQVLIVAGLGTDL